MANNVLSNPIVLDTTTVGESIDLNSKRVLSIYWFSPTSAGDDVLLTHDGGQTLFVGKAEADLGSQFFQIGGSQGIQVRNVRVNTIDSGVIYLYVAD